ATGGDFSINQVVTNSVKELVVPKNVIGLDNFSTNGTVRFAGKIINFGSVYGLSTSAAVTSGTLSVRKLVNERGGLVSTQLPGSVLSQVAGAISNDSFVLSSDKSLRNLGTISSGGSLSLTSVSGSIRNMSAITAVNAINLSAGKGTILNGGTIQTS